MRHFKTHILWEDQTTTEEASTICISLLLASSKSKMAQGNELIEYKLQGEF